MEALTSADLLDVWERGASKRNHDRALVLLGYARPDLEPAALATVPIGGRDAALLQLRATTFGRTMAAIATCPGCDEQLEIELDVPASTDPAGHAADPDGRTEGEPIVVAAGSRTVRIRRPTTADLSAALEAAADAGGDPGVARRELIGRLVLDPPRTGIDGDLERAIEEALGADGTLDPTIAAICPACGHAWDTWIDVPGFLWTEVAAAARRLAGDVAGLAAAYGWRESDVLALTPWRRQLYLDLAGE
jgi:hypothetical protein